jgi:hypothetical protein
MLLGNLLIGYVSTLQKHPKKYQTAFFSLFIGCALSASLYYFFEINLYTAAAFFFITLSLGMRLSK